MDLRKKEGYNNTSKSDSKLYLDKTEKKSKNIKPLKIGIILLIFVIVAIVLALFFKSSSFSKESPILLKIESVYVNLDNSSAVINLQRIGEGRMTKIEFSFYDFDGNSYLYYYDLEEGLPVSGEIKSYLVDSSWIPDLTNFLALDYVSIAYYYINSEGEEVSSTIRDSFGNSFFEDIRDPDNNITSNPAPIQPRPSSGGGGGGGKKSSSGGGNENPGCSPDSLSVTCSNNKCGTQTNNCLAPVDCGICTFNISSCVELQNINNDLTANYNLVNDIDCSATIGWNNGSGFIPIGNLTSIFIGNFSGRNNIISNLYINRSNENYIGLFGVINSTVSDVGVVNANIKGNSDVGALVGYNEGTVTRSYSTGNVSGNGSVGGLVGFEFEGSIFDSYSDVTVISFISSAGGLVGVVGRSGVVGNSYSTGNVTGRDAGGLVGLVGGNPGLISNSYSTGNVIGSNNMGGLFGTIMGSQPLLRMFNVYWNNHSGNSDNCYSGGDVNCSVIQNNFNYFKNDVYPDKQPFTVWDFASVWEEKINDYPVLRWQGIGNGNILNISCDANSDCPVGVSSGFVCSGNNVNRTYLNYTCINPGTSLSLCIGNTNSYFNNSCPGDINSSNFCRTTNLSVVYYNLTDNLCSGGGCISNLITNLPKSVCPFGTMCSGGNCVAVTCSFNLSCGTQINSSLYCLGGNVYKNVSDPICLNAGLPSSSCTRTNSSVLVQSCGSGTICSGGACLPVACSLDSSCGTDGFGITFCNNTNGNVYRNFTDYSCTNPGTPTSACNISITSVFNQTCPQDSNSSNYCRTANLSIVYYNLTDNGCSSGNCTSNVIVQLTKSICPFGTMCSGGNCVVSNLNPVVNFISPTPVNSTTIANRYVIINASISDSNLNQVIFNWNGVNYSILDNSAVAIYNFDNRVSLGENSLIVNDISGNANNGTVLGATFNSTGKYNGAYTFDGNGDYISRTSTLLTTNYPFTMSAWFIKNKTNEGSIFVVENGDEIGANYGVGAGTKGIIYADPGDTPYSAQGTTIINDNKWHHIIGVFNSAGDKRLYIDGINEANLTNSVAYNIFGDVNAFTVGYSFSREVYFNGSIDEVIFFNRSLSASEIQQLYFSNLYKYNSSQWYLYTNQSGLSNGNYNYQVHAVDSLGAKNSSEKRDINIQFVEVINCTTSSDCGINSTNFSCLFNNVYRNTLNFSCNNPGTPSSFCTNSTGLSLIETCGAGTSCSTSGACVSSSSGISISTCQQLQDMQNDLSANYSLINDVDCSVTTSWDSGKGFKPIGNDTNPFTGNFNGNNHTISNLYIKRPSENHVAMFGYATGSIKDLGITNVNISGFSRSGSILGILTGSLSNSYSTGNVNGSTYTGGLVGYNSGGNIINSYSKVNVKGGQYVGGLASLNGYLSNITNSYSRGNVTGFQFIGGLVGYNNVLGYITNSYATGNVNASLNVAGLVGSNLGNVTNSYSTGSVNGSTFNGGLVGYNLGKITSSYWNNHSGNPSNCYDGGNTGCIPIQNDQIYFYDIINAPMNSWNFVNIWSSSNDGFNFPILKWEEGGLPNLSSNLFERFVNHLKRLFGYA